ncbi:MAG: hypothetical protein ACRC33_00965 [Gemmataceae bacterium]
MTQLRETPVVVQEWNAGSRLALRPAAVPAVPADPRVGLVVGTYAAVPYVHLQLEARRRFYPGVPLLVHDDGSHRAAELRELCRRYGCDFERNERRQPPCVGDLTAFVGGLAWAEARGLDLLVKVSRRWLFRVDWEPGLKALAAESGYATYCSYTTTFGFGFRTECVGLAVAAWSADEFVQDVTALIRDGVSVFVEGYLHEYARRFERRNGPAAEAWRAAHPMPDDRGGYALWALMGTDRCAPSPSFLWHDSSGPEDYLAVSREWGLPYDLTDFTDPNQGADTGV